MQFFGKRRLSFVCVMLIMALMLPGCGQTPPPTITPTPQPTNTPVASPTAQPTSQSTPTATIQPTNIPTSQPAQTPAAPPTSTPTSQPTISLRPAPQIQAPTGFAALLYATNLGEPVAMAYGPDGRLFITQLNGEVVAHDEAGGARRVFARGLKRPTGLAWRGQDLYVVQQGTISILRDTNGDGVADERKDIIINIPSDEMQNGMLALGADDWFYVGIGALCDHCAPDNPQSAQIRRFKPDGSAWQTYATGLRNPFGLAFAPDGQLYATDNGREELGDELPPDELNRIEAGAYYGFPQCWGDRVADPAGGGTAAFCATTRAPIATFDAHTAAAGLAFYTGTTFPAEYRGDAFVALHGAWFNPARGRVVQRVKLPTTTNGRAQTSAFARGFGRPVGVAISRDGALLVSDLERGAIYKIMWAGAR